MHFRLQATDMSLLLLAKSESLDGPARLGMRAGRIAVEILAPLSTPSLNPLEKRAQKLKLVYV